MLEILLEIFTKSSSLFLVQEAELITSGVSERCWYAPFSRFLDEETKKNNITGYYADVEYNRNNGKLKTIFDDKTLEIIPITCDIILHSRGHIFQLDNLICIEMKKSDRPISEKLEDKKRLKLLTKKSFDGIWSADGKTLPEHVCGYQLGVYYEINIAKRIVYIEYYKEGNMFYEKSIRF